MGRAASKLTKPVRNFNIENRAAKVLQNQAENPKASPKYPSTQNAISQLQEEHPEFLEAQTLKNEALHENLKKLYVEPEESPIEIKSAPRPLPSSRKPAEETDLGSMDIDYAIPRGKVDLKTILGFIGEHQVDPTNVTAETISEQYQLDAEEVRNVLRHFKAYQLHIPQAMHKENPKLKRIMEDQMKSAASTLSQFKISKADDQKQLGAGVNTDQPPSNR